MVNLLPQAKTFVSGLRTVRGIDADDARRRKLLNDMLISTFLVGLFLQLTTLIGLTAGQYIFPQALSFIILILISQAGFGIVYLLNRHVSGRLASSLFLLFVLAIIGFSDSIPELIGGRSLLIFAVPILASSVILGAGASFVFYILSVAEIAILARIGGVGINELSIVMLSVIPLLSWFSSRSLEQAVKDLRSTNANLDRLVDERTEALARSLAQQRAEAEQREIILNSMADGVIVLDDRGTSLLSNPAAQALLGIPGGPMAAGSLANLLDAPALSRASKDMLQAMVRTKSYPERFRVEWGKKVLSASAARLHGPANEENGTVFIFRDVTREAELERMKSSFVAMVSHELRTPLGAIMGFAEMLREGTFGRLSPKQSGACERILTNAGNMLGMVNDLLDQAQIEAGKLRVNDELFRPVDLLKSVRDTMSPALAAKGLTFTEALDLHLPDALHGDVQRLKQIVTNLVANSAKFTDVGDIFVRFYRAADEKWGIEVRDTGCGIPPEELDRIFDAFHQVEDGTGKEQPGFGLGLAIVKQLVMLMQGEITVQSAIGSGSTFTITLPLMEKSSERTTRMSHSALIIEDDPDLASIFAEALTASGFKTEVIQDGALAQARIRSTLPQVILLDLHLPHVDGSTLLHQVRSDPLLEKTIVIVATADAVKAEQYRQRADIVLIKPLSFVQLRDLSSRLQKVLGDSGS